MMYTKKDIIDQLIKMGVPRDVPVLVHSSLRAVGEVEGRADGLIDALKAHICADGGLLCIPTHTWANMGKLDEPTLDMLGSTCIGTLPNIAAGREDACRSDHPTHSMAVFGEGAEEFVSGEDKMTTPAHPDGCYGKIYDEGGVILLVGVNHSKNTYLHAVEEMLHVPHRMTEDKIRIKVRRASGEVVLRDIHWFDESYVGDASHRFPKYELAFRYHRAITDGFIGNAPTQLCDARIMKNVLELIAKNAGDKDPLEDDRPFPPKWYCNK